ncbi:DPH6 [Mytilus coruscus]|uniref:Diphthine--ammonia ligase n=1 Tax=Mytilus coruscus TaxID=42192 RepID=A0A6J8ADL0_MYTCO|nr:DPH6 [Mytilus coruscus]
MKTVALISGGKDSCYNMMQCVIEGHDIIALANLRPKEKDEMDSYMYQTVGHHAIHLYAEAIGLPLYRHTIEGSSTTIKMDYKTTEGDEVEDLYTLLKKIKDELQIEAVSVGAILSDYQRVRVEHVCQRLGLTSLAYLWRRDQSELLKEMIDSGVSAILIKVASMGLNPKNHLGRSLKELYPQLLQMNREFQLNVCGEGGEYETFTVDCPLFNKSIVM